MVQAHRALVVARGCLSCHKSLHLNAAQLVRARSCHCNAVITVAEADITPSCLSGEKLLLIDGAMPIWLSVRAGI